MSNVVAEISRQDLQDGSTPLASITDVKYLSSYNWIDRPTPTIAVPGSPSLWHAPPGSQQLKKDSGLVYVDQNAARHPDSPLEPIFRAMYITNPSFDIRSVDVVTDRTNIRKLFSFINAGLTASEPDAFTIGIEVTKQTALFRREENSPREWIEPDIFKGFGREFRKIYTTSQISDSTGHHRIISYRFGNLDFVVRYETDGYMGDSLQSILGSLPLSPSSSSSPLVSPASKLAIQQGGQTVPFDSIIEIKTRASKNRIHIHEAAPELWLSQTSKLVRAYHLKGTFQDPKIENVAAHIKQWEEVNQKLLRMLAGLIHKILNLVKGCGGYASITYDGGDKIVVRKVDGKRMLPNDLYSKWDPNMDSQDATHAPDGRTTDTDASHTAQEKTESDDQSITFPPKGVTDQYRIPGHLPFADVIKNGVNNGFRQIFRHMPTQLSAYHDICKTLTSLSIDVTEGRTMRDIMADMRTGKSDWDPEERRQVKGSKTLARDSAFRLLYVFLQGRSGLAVGDSNMAYNAALFVVSHSGIFKYRTRKMVREAFMDQFRISEKQRQSLDKWPIKDHSSAGSQEDDVTTEEDFGLDSDFDSDFSF